MRFTLAALLVLVLVVPASAQEAGVSLGDLLTEEYGATVEWTVQTINGVETITFWRPIERPPRSRSTPIPQPTPAQIAAWKADSALVGRIRAKEKAQALDPAWRALVTALCVAMVCADEEAVWEAFLSALP